MLFGLKFFPSINPNVYLSSGSRASTSFASVTWCDGDGHAILAGANPSSACDNAISARRSTLDSVLGGAPKIMQSVLCSMDPT
jgi:hypothetical protein